MSPNCKSFHDGMMMTHANDIGLMSQPVRAARELVAQCAARHSATIALSDGSSIEVKCSAMAPVAAYFYDLDIDKTLKHLGYALKKSSG